MFRIQEIVFDEQWTVNEALKIVVHFENGIILNWSRRHWTHSIFKHKAFPAKDFISPSTTWDCQSVAAFIRWLIRLCWNPSSRFNIHIRKFDFRQQHIRQWFVSTYGILMRPKNLVAICIEYSVWSSNYWLKRSSSKNERKKKLSLIAHSRWSFIAMKHKKSKCENWNWLKVPVLCALCSEPPLLLLFLSSFFFFVFHQFFCSVSRVNNRKKVIVSVITLK